MGKENKYVIPFLFLRTKDPRPEYAEHIIQYVEQVKLRNKYKTPLTCLMTYDAMCDEKMVGLVKADMNEQTDVGLWMELCKDVVENVGIVWRGLKDWEWTVEPGFLMAYDKEEKEKIIDCFMEKYYSLFGCYPKTVGSWLIDSYSMQYITEKYDPDAFVICREQWAMDAYTLWGGPYYGGYYPSKNNMICPAQTEEAQINTPVFRAYVNDQIYCYYEHERTKYNDLDYHLFTQEPAWMCGGMSKWVNWHYNNLFKNNSEGFLYTQIGQENGFPWTNELEIALKSQFQFAHENKEEYGFEYTTFADMGRTFKEKYSATPNTCVYALDDWAGKGNKSVWFNSNKYRINIFSDKEKVWIRDLQLFDENHRDEYLDKPCRTKLGVYDNLPVVDGVQFSDVNTQGGIFIGKGTITSVDKNDDDIIVRVEADDKEIIFLLLKDKIKIFADMDFEMKFVCSEKCDCIVGISKNESNYRHRNGDKYALVIENGNTEGTTIYSKGREIVLSFRNY